MSPARPLNLLSSALDRVRRLPARDSGVSRFRSRARAGAVAASLAVALPLLAPVPADAAGFRLVFEDEFQGNHIDGSNWGVYNGGNGGQRVASNTTVGGGVLTLRTQRVNGVWKGAGVSAARANRQTYGKYEIRVRFDRGYGVRAVALLWPAAGGWPPEVDFYEIPASNTERTVNTVTNHFRTSHDPHGMTHGSYPGDFTRWQTISVEWTPGRLVYKMNGEIVDTMTSHVPSQPMWLGMQTRAGSSLGIQPDGRTPGVVDMEVDWVRIYDYN